MEDTVKRITKKVKAYIRKYKLISAGDRILLGLSGGADSVCLFYLLADLQGELDFGLRVVHVHHGIRPEAERDTSYVEKICKEQGISCEVFREEVLAFAKKQGLTEEEAGRILRYRDFRKALENWREEDASKCYKIAVAHHINDQAETVLFQLFRGSGLAGLRGMLPERDDIIRPLLGLSREEIERYLTERGIIWCEDRTNASVEYSRNKIRHNILPYAEQEICTGAIGHIGKTAEILQEAEDYIRRQTKEAFSHMAAEEGESRIVFDIPRLTEADVFIKKQALLYSLEKLSAGRKNIGSVHIEDILELLQKQGNGELFLPGKLTVRKSYQKLIVFGEKAEEDNIVIENRGFFTAMQEPIIETELFRIPEDEEQKKIFLEGIPEKTYTKWFDYAKIGASYVLRHREKGDFLTIDSLLHHKTVKEYMVQEKIPAEMRDKIWLLADGSHVMWIPGGRMSAFYKVSEQTENVLQISIRNGG